MRSQNATDNWQGVVIEESLQDKSLLNIVNIIDTKTSRLENENRIKQTRLAGLPSIIFLNPYIQVSSSL